MLTNDPLTSNYSKTTFDVDEIPTIPFKLENYTILGALVSGKGNKITTEWESHGVDGSGVIPEIRIVVTESNSNIVNSTGPTLNDGGPKVIVRTEEVTLVVLVLILWVAAIALFFNRWGKIRMLEPYQPKFQQQHRASCLVDLDPLQPPKGHRTSLSRMSMGMVMQFPTQFSPPQQYINCRGYQKYARPRQNSVFVGPNIAVPLQSSRKTRSAFDIHSMVLDEAPENV